MDVGRPTLLESSTPNKSVSETEVEYGFPPGVGQFGEFLACQSGKTVKVDKVANLFWGCQSGETAKAVKVAKVVGKGGGEG